MHRLEWRGQQTQAHARPSHPSAGQRAPQCCGNSMLMTDVIHDVSRLGLDEGKESPSQVLSICDSNGWAVSDSS